MDTQQFALQPNTIIDIAFQYKNYNYNFYIDTVQGLIILEELGEKNEKNPVFVRQI